MIGDYDKYRSQLFQVAGLSLFTPLGKLFIDIKGMKVQDFNFALLTHLIVALFFAYIGIIAIDRGAEVLKKGK